MKDGNSAAIKLMHSADTIIRDNLIRGVYRQDDRAAFGIWIDCSNQGLRISRNIIDDTETEALFLEMNHGPILVDNIILIGPNGLRRVLDGHEKVAGFFDGSDLVRNASFE